MKTAVIAFLFLPMCATLYAQIDTSAAGFFPSAVGNAWHYADSPVTRLTRDSVGPDGRYLFFDDSDGPRYLIDPILNVVQNPTSPWYRRLKYELNAPLLEWWVVQTYDSVTGRPALDARVDSVFWGSLFGVVTRVKAIGYHFAQRINDTTYHYWHHEEYIAAGFGFFLSFYDPPIEATDVLIGCIINGRRYGTMLSVGDDQTSSNPSLYELYPAYPNPFNPSTRIRYRISNRPARPDGTSGAGGEYVTVKIYDLLGREVATLVDGMQGVGLHSTLWEPQSMSSGAYFVRLTARHFTATAKLIYSK